MLTPDVLLPAIQPIVADILLSAPVTIDPAAVTAALAKRHIPLGDHIWTSSPDGLQLAIRGGEMRITPGERPIAAESLTSLLEDAASWWDVSAVRTHTSVLTVSVASTEHPASTTAGLAVRLTAAVIDTTTQANVPVAGVRWNGERLLPPDFVQDQARTEPPLGILMGLHVGTSGSGLALYTSGLPALGLMNIEVAEFDGDLEAAAAVVQHWALELIERGPSAIAAGTTIGSSPEDQVHVTIDSSSGTPVYRFTFEGDGPAIAEPPRESITCPECGAQVEAEVMRMGFMAMMMECPACGAGPVALLGDMLETMGGGEISVTFETTNAVSLAKLLSEHDPRFDTIVEAADYLKSRYDGARAVVPMQRNVAGVISASIESDYPDIRISADEALGVMEDTGSKPIFHAASNDMTMSEAIGAARASVGEFIARLASPQSADESFGVKVRVDDGEEVEHMWLGEVRREGNEFVGTLEAEPRSVTNVRAGQVVRVATDQISDWGFTNGTAMHGNYTLRAMLSSLPKAMQESFRARLVPLK